MYAEAHQICWTLNWVYSCSSSLHKELPPSLLWREVVMTLDDQAPIVTLAKFCKPLPRLLHRPQSSARGGILLVHVEAATTE